MKLPTLEGVRRAELKIREHLTETPLILNDHLSHLLGREVWLKLETASPIASFKLRGALTAIHRAMEQGHVTHVCTSSTGNHALGVTLAARLLGCSADIFLPEQPNPVKRAAIARLGGAIHETGIDLDDSKLHAIAFAKAIDALFVDDGESLDVMEGAGTVGLEIARRLEGIDTVYVPMGSGTLVTGIAVAVKAMQPTVRVVAVQAKGSPAMVESFKAGESVQRSIATLADGLACRIPARRALAGLLAFVDDAKLISDGALLGGVRTLIETAHQLSEPAGAAGLSGLLSEPVAGQGSGRVVVVVTGANITRELLDQALTGNPLVQT